MAIKGAIEGFRGAMSKREKLRRAKKKDSVHPIGDGENGKARSSAKKKGAHDGTRTRTHVGMSKRLDLRNKGQEGTSHQTRKPPPLGGVDEE